MRIIVLAALAAIGALPAGAAEAQVHAHTLADGRVVTVTTPVADCDPPNVGSDAGFSISLAFGCQVPAADGGPVDTPAEGALIVRTEAGQLTPDQFALQQARIWWPERSDDIHAAHISRVSKVFANGPLEMVCVYRDNIDALNGEAVCVLGQATTQLVIGGLSTMASTADNFIDTILRSVTIR